MNWRDHLEAAEGYLGLGMLDAANNELERITPEDRARPQVYLVRLHIYVHSKKWDAAEVVAQHLAGIYEQDPKLNLTWAMCARHAKSPEAAEKILISALVKFPENAELFYELACAIAIQERLHEAKSLLAKAFNRDMTLRLRALDDDDLQAVWDEIEKMG